MKHLNSTRAIDALRRDEEGKREKNKINEERVSNPVTLDPTVTYDPQGSYGPILTPGQRGCTINGNVIHFCIKPFKINL